jgi:hypothetical protein
MRSLQKPIADGLQYPASALAVPAFSREKSMIWHIHVRRSVHSVSESGRVAQNRQRRNPTLMSIPEPDDPRATFEHLSNEYAQALQAYQAIENQASTLLMMGYTDDLRQFIEQFLTMARSTRDLAVERGEMHFAEWFGELVQKAEALRMTVPR